MREILFGRGMYRWLGAVVAVLLVLTNAPAAFASPPTWLRRDFDGFDHVGLVRQFEINETIEVALNIRVTHRVTQRVRIIRHDFDRDLDDFIFLRNVELFNLNRAVDTELRLSVVTTHVDFVRLVRRMHRFMLFHRRFMIQRDFDIQ